MIKHLKHRGCLSRPWKLALAFLNDIRIINVFCHSCVCEKALTDFCHRKSKSKLIFYFVLIISFSKKARLICSVVVLMTDQLAYSTVLLDLTVYFYWHGMKRVKHIKHREWKAFLLCSYGNSLAFNKHLTCIYKEKKKLHISLKTEFPSYYLCL